MEFLLKLLKDTGLWDRLASAGLPDVWITVIAMAVGAFILGFIPLLSLFFLIWYERKIVARIGDRMGPNNTGAPAGPYGLLQVPLDAIKMFTKEDVVPALADRWVFNIAPVVIMAIAILVWAVIPLGKGIIGADLNIGVFYILSFGSGGILAMLMAGWASDNKYALLGALRGVATLVSYEIPQVLSILAVVMVAGSFSLSKIIEAQDVCFLVTLPLTAMIFFASTLSELGRRPFDLVEADSEIVAGYFIEYSGIKFGMFYLAEFINQLMISVLFATLFLGGWRGPGVDQLPALSVVWLIVKTMLAMLAIQFFQYTLPRLRIDQILSVNWKFFTPLALLNICVIALAGKIPVGDSAWARSGLLLAANVALALAVWVALSLADRQAQRQRKLAGSRTL